MKQYFKYDPWRIIEQGFDPERNLVSESCFSIGNGMMGQRANFEESYSGASYQGSYIAGVFDFDEVLEPYKVGLPTHFPKLLNVPKWQGIDIWIDGEVLDLATCKVKDFRRVLDLQTGILERSFTAKMVSGKEVNVIANRFCSMAQKEILALEYNIKPLNFNGIIKVAPYLDGNATSRNNHSNGQNWAGVGRVAKNRSGYLLTDTKNTKIRVCTGMKFDVFKNKKIISFKADIRQDDRFISCTTEIKCVKGDEVSVCKYVIVATSLSHKRANLFDFCQTKVRLAQKSGFEKLKNEHIETWAEKWKTAEIYINGDEAAQQAIRFNMFQLFQAFSGDGKHQNLGPKGFTGEKHGGLTHWDTEAICLPFYLSVAGESVARNLLITRHKQLKKAIQNASNLGFTFGAALYPMATMNGQESHPDWEISLCEIHRNGAIAHAIHHFVYFTGDQVFLANYGLEILVGIARFWAQRVHWSGLKGKYVLHGVTGPNSYEVNVNNNWYTNYIAAWSLNYAVETVRKVEEKYPEIFSTLTIKLKLDLPNETAKWAEISTLIYLPKDNNLGVFLQQDGFLEKHIQSVTDIPESQRPIFQHWSKDRILRSSFIKQADVLMGLYFFENDFEPSNILKNFEFYVPMTLHESSLSPCIHTVLAARLGKLEMAMEIFNRAARLDLDNYQNDTEEGLHITSMAGTWLALVEGFGGMRVEENLLSFSPVLPDGWSDFSFKICWRGHLLQLKMTPSGAAVLNLSMEEIEVKLNGRKVRLIPEATE